MKLRVTYEIDAPELVPTWNRSARAPLTVANYWRGMVEKAVRLNCASATVATLAADIHYEHPLPRGGVA